MGPVHEQILAVAVARADARTWTFRLADVVDALPALTDRDVDFVIVGGVALILQGSARLTRDLDLCYSRDRKNLKALASALAPFGPTLRGAPAMLPFTLDWQTLESGLNFTLTTRA